MNYNKHNPEEILEYINKVEAPPFLLTRIKQKIANKGDAMVPTQWAFAAGISLLLVLALNFYVIAGTTNHKHQETNIAETMNLYPHNSLYE